MIDHPERWQRLTELLAPFHDAASRTARRLAGSAEEGDDLMQEAVLRAFDHLHGLRDESRFRSWFYTVLLSVHRNRSRRGFWRRFLSLDARREAGFEPAGADGGEEAELRGRARRAARALAALAPAQREAVVLFEMEGYSVDEIAALQHSSVPAVKSRLSRGRERLRRSLEKVDPNVDVLRATSRRAARFGRGTSLVSE